MIVKCSHCQKMLDEIDFGNHTCSLKSLSDVKNIEVVYFQDVSHGNRKLMTGLGVDGVLYRFEVVARKAIPLMEPLSRRKFTVKNNRRRVYRTKICG